MANRYVCNITIPLDPEAVDSDATFTVKDKIRKEFDMNVCTIKIIWYSLFPGYSVTSHSHSNVSPKAQIRLTKIEL